MAFEASRKRYLDQLESERKQREQQQHIEENTSKRQRVCVPVLSRKRNVRDFSENFALLSKHTRRAHEDYISSSIIPPISESFDNPKYEHVVHPGDIILKNALAAFDQFPGLKLTAQQRQITTAAVKTALPKIYGDAWESERLRVLAENGWTSFRPELFVVTPRRFGKTTAIATHAVSMLTSVPTFKLVLLAVCKRQARSLLSMIAQMLTKHPMFERNELKCSVMNTDRIELNWPDGSKSEVDAFPARTDVRFVSSLFLLLVIHKHGYFFLAVCFLVSKK
jgi:hypothetical protein